VYVGSSESDKPAETGFQVFLREMGVNLAHGSGERLQAAIFVCADEIGCGGRGGCLKMLKFWGELAHMCPLGQRCAGVGGRRG
jgi:hypothetical protein